MNTQHTLDRMTPDKPWRERLSIVDSLMREVSKVQDPQEVVRLYSTGVRALLPVGKWVAVSRRGLAAPRYRITRYSRWEGQINPWLEKERLPLFDSGLLGELLYAGKVAVIDDLRPDPADPAFEFLKDQRAMLFYPQYDSGEALNAGILLWDDPDHMHALDIPNIVWQGNLFGRTTGNLVLRQELANAYGTLDRELQVVGNIQRSLLPAQLPEIPGFELAARYQPSAHAGGDYYDIFKLPNGRWGFLIADVSGHGTPAAVLMAVTHAIARTFSGSPEHPCQFLDHLNQKLVDYYTVVNGAFVTAFYGVLDPARHEFRYACAGHNPPRLICGTTITPLDAVGGLPLGIMPTQECAEAAVPLHPGDRICLYTDGIVESQDDTNELFDVPRLDHAILNGSADCDSTASRILDAVETYTNKAPAKDDRTLVMIRRAH